MIGPMMNEGQQREIVELEAALAAEYADTFSDDIVHTVMADCVERLRHHLVKHDYLPIFAAKFTRERLEAHAHNAGLRTIDHPQVLFVCNHNTGASILAAAMFNARAEGRAYARSAGVTPGGEMMPVLHESLDELGIDKEFRFPRSLTDDILEASDVLVTLGHGDEVPLMADKEYVNWQEPEWVSADLVDVDLLRDDLSVKVNTLLDELLSVDSSR